MPEPVVPSSRKGFRARLPDVVALLAVPAICGVLGDWLIFHLFGNGRFLPTGSTGDHVIRWWDRSFGREIVPALLSLMVMLLTRRRLSVALSTAAASALLSLLFWVAATLVSVALNPGALD